MKRTRAAGFAAVIVLHAAVLYGLWSCKVIPPPTEALTVFVSFINPQTLPKPAEVTLQKPVQPEAVRRESVPVAAPVVQKLLVSDAPLTTPLTPVVAPVAKAQPQPEQMPVPVSVPAVSRPAAAVAVTKPEPVAVSQPLLMSGELAVSCMDRPAPAYPRQSARLGEQGKVVLRVELDELGRVANAVIDTSSGFPRLDEAAVATVKAWHCNPAKRNGVAVRAIALQPFNFTLKGR